MAGIVTLRAVTKGDSLGNQRVEVLQHVNVADGRCRYADVGGLMAVGAIGYGPFPIAVSFLLEAALLPAIRAARLPVAEALRYT